MDANIKSEWLAWLENPASIQAHGQLRQGDGFCALGGLCDIAVRHGIAEWDGNAIVNPHADDLYDDYSVNALPFFIQAWAGIDDPDPQFRVETQGVEILEHASDFNDFLEYSLPEIGALVREQL